MPCRFTLACCAVAKSSMRPSFDQTTTVHRESLDQTISVCWGPWTRRRPSPGSPRTRRSASAVGPWTRRRPCAAGLTRRDSRRGPSDRAAGRDARACSAPAADLEINVTSTSYSLVHIARSKLNSSCSKHRKPT